MNSTRVTNFALGKYNNFQARTDGVFTSTDTSPDVTDGVLFYTNNATPTTITDFDLRPTSQTPGEYEGKKIVVVFLDTNTRLAKSSALKVPDGVTYHDAGDVASFIYHGSAWYQTSESKNKTVDVLTKTLVSGNTYNLIVNKDTVNYALATTMVNMSVRSISGGYLGQEINVFNVSVGTGILYIMSDGNINMSSAQVIISPTAGAAKFICVSSSPVIWNLVNAIVGN